MPKTLNNDRQHLDLVIDPTVGQAWLDARLPAFREAHSEIAVTLTASAATKRPSDSFQAAVLIGDGDWPGATSELLMELDDFVVCSPGLLSDQKFLAQAGRLAGFTLLHEGTRERWQRWLTAAGADDIDTSQGPVFETAADCLAAAQAGEGMALANDLTAAPHLRTGSLVKALAATQPSGRAVYLVVPRGRADAPAVAAFRTWLLRELRRWAAA